MTVRIEPVVSRRHRADFRGVPTILHGSDPRYIPELDLNLKALLDRGRNPFWKRAEAQEWVAYRSGEPVGRIGACRDEMLVERAPGTGTIGFFASTDDEEAATRLFETGYSWLRERDCDRARGPLSYCIHDTGGLLVEGFDTRPTVDTTWNPAYYVKIWEQAGWIGVKDLLGLAGQLQHGGPERGRKFADRARRKGFSARPVDFSRFEQEIDLVCDLYNSAWDDNWGHVPISREHFAYKAKDMKAVLDPDLVRIAEFEGKPVGFFLGLPDLNVAVRRSRGRMFPLGWWRLLRAKHNCERVRVITLGVIPGFRQRGVEALLLSDSYDGWGNRYTWSEASWVLADNAAMLNGLALYNLFPYKRWRLLEREL